jgi:hypothetical protein
MAIKRYTEEQIRSMKSLTDWERVKNMKDEDLDLTDPDAPEVSELIRKGILVPAEHPLKIFAARDAKAKKAETDLKSSKKVG